MVDLNLVIIDSIFDGIFDLDIQLPSQYIQFIPKRVLGAPGKVWRIQLVEKPA